MNNFLNIRTFTICVFSFFFEVAKIKKMFKWNILLGKFSVRKEFHLKFKILNPKWIIFFSIFKKIAFLHVIRKKNKFIKAPNPKKINCF